jgi:hypothetical protein
MDESLTYIGQYKGTRAAAMDELDPEPKRSDLRLPSEAFVRRCHIERDRAVNLTRAELAKRGRLPEHPRKVVRRRPKVS